MSDSKKAYQEALNIKKTSSVIYIQPELIDRIVDNYYRILYACNINWNDILWERMLYKKKLYKGDFNGE